MAAAAPAGQREKAEAFGRLHEDRAVLVLPNAWDVASAVMIADAGAPAIATASATVAFSRGYPDGEAIGRDEMLSVVAAIAATVPVPVSADLEAGYGATADEVGETARLAIAAGAVGMNLEDSLKDGPAALRDPGEAAARIAAAVAAGEALGVPLVVNARTDVFLLGIGEPADRLAHAVARANAYRAAGAGSLFVPGVRDADTIAALADGIDGPLNVLAGPGIPSVQELGALGVARLSLGPMMGLSAFGYVRRATRALLATGDVTPLMEDVPSFPEMTGKMKAG